MATRRAKTTLRSEAVSRQAPRQQAGQPGKRDTVKAKKITFYAKRTAEARVSEIDENARSLKADRRRTAQTKARFGYRDRADGAT
jgi:hypothetical protein